MSINLYDALKNSYKDKKTQQQGLKKYGFDLDNSLSNDNQQVYYNKKNKKLLFNVSGTHKISDWVTDAYLATGHLKDTSRYKQAKSTFNIAKQKYNPKNTSVVGHSLGATIGGYIAGKNDKVYTLNKGATIGQKIRSNETHFRTNGDVVSLLNANSKHTINLQNPNLLKDAYNAHSISTIRNKNIKI